MNKLIPLFTFTLNLHLLFAAVPLRWTVETSRAVPAQFEAYQGETLTFEAALQSYGKPIEAPSNYSLYWQTNGMGNAWWEVKVKGEGEQRNDSSAVHLDPSPSPTNVMFATWSPTNDVGAKVYNCFIGQPGTIYHAAFQLRLRPSPGATPNVLPLPTPVIDFAKVTVLNPPWSGGGGGGVDTNAVIDIVRKTVDGSARTLPPYLHYLEMDDTYPDAAAEWYAQADYSHGSCSAVRNGNTLSRNYDWKFDFMPEFVVRTVAASATGAGTSGRFASIAVCNVGTNLTEADVVSGKWSRWYKALPGHAVDGINENGVACEINVVSTNGVENWHGNPATDGIHCLAAVRWVLDNATSAEMAASNLAERVYVPEGMGNFHYMIADRVSTIVVENGRVQYDWRYFPPDRSTVILTNYLVLMPDEESGLYCYLPEESFFFYGESGSGLERYITLQDALSPRPRTNITNVWYTNAYRRETNPPWVSDLADVIAYTNDIYNAWASHPKEYFRNKTNGGEPWWQTVHTSIYDLKNLTLKIAAQETDDWYVFQVPSSGGLNQDAVREIVTPMIGAATNDFEAANTDHQVVRGQWLGSYWGIEVANSRNSIYARALQEDENHVIDFGYLSGNTKPSVTFNGGGYWYGLTVEESLGGAVPVWEYDQSLNVNILRPMRRNGMEVLRYDLALLNDPANWGALQHFNHGAEVDHTFSGELNESSVVNKGMLDAAISATDPTFSNAVDTIVRSIMPTKLRAYDPVRQCWWNIQPVNGVLTLTVED